MRRRAGAGDRRRFSREANRANTVNFKMFRGGVRL